ncbi:MAG: T9SS type A sorting domain-containing protein [Bacteroidetes bacterium]|nr:T9SS type A sorting domain-containing protein [Bacteroidota bacterium]
MKKITLLMAALFVTSALFAGEASDNAMHHGKTKNNFHPAASPSLRGSSHSANSIATLPFYLQDFSAGTVPAGWSNVSTLGTMLWTWTNTGAAGVYTGGVDSLSLTLSSSANGYMKFDSDSSGASIGGEHGVLTSSAISCTGHSAVHLTLNEFFLQFAVSTGIIYVSNDSVTWTPVHHAETGLGQNQFTANPLVPDINISSIAANQATVYVRFEYVGDWDYFWFIDDIALFEPVPVDGSIDAVGVNFNGCNLSATETIRAHVKNNGGSPITGFPVSYTVNGGTPVTETYTGTLNGGDTATFVFAQTADLSANAVYTIQAYSAVAGDTIHGNDTAVAVTASYAHIDPSVSAYTMGFESTDDFSAWTTQDVDGDGITFDISSAYVHGGTQCIRKPASSLPDNNWLFSQCIDINSGGTYSLSYWYKNFDLTFMCNLEVYMGIHNDSASMTQLIVQSPLPTDTTYHQTTAAISVSPGTYYIGFHFYASASTSSLRLDDINIDFTTGVKENAAVSAINIFPNPSNGKINITNGNKMEKEFVVNVYNSVGQNVFSKKYTDLISEQIDLTEQPNGIYSVQLKSEKNTINKSIVISNK